MATLPLFCTVTVTLQPWEVLAITGAPARATTTVGGPLETTRFTVAPSLSVVPAPGDWLMTSPEAIMVLACVVTVPSVRLAPVIAVVAAVCVRPTTFGTVVVGGPVDTTKFTAVPPVSEKPAAGDWLMTSPEGTDVLACRGTVPSVRLAPVMAAVAAAWVRPATFGTVGGGGPEETTRFTAVPTFSVSPAAGDWLMTS